MSLKDLQQSFMGYLLRNDARFADSVLDQGPVDTKTRLHIYANAYRVRLREAIEVDHPILGAYLGDEWFDQMVTGYTDTHPSSARSLRYFAEALPDYLAQTLPFRTQPILAEMAAFERALMGGFDAADAQRINLDALQAVPPEQWPGMTFEFHPSLSMFKAQWNSVESWQAIKAEQAPPAAEAKQQTWAIWRNRERLTEFVSLEPVQSHMLDAALHSHCFADICEGLLGYLSETEVSAAAVTELQQWFEYGWLSAIHLQDEPPS